MDQPVATWADPSHPGISQRRSRAIYLVLAGLVLVGAVNLFAGTYVLAEHYIYTWDRSLYWNKFGHLGELLRSSPFSAAAYTAWSIGNDDYTVLPLLPLLPFEMLFGPGRLPYILAITNLALLPSAALMAWLAERPHPNRSWTRVFLALLAVLCLHVLWVPALRGLPDVLGVAIACSVLLVYLRQPLAERSLLQLIGLGLLLGMLVLTRRWYLFWAASLFPAALAAHVLSSPSAERSWKGALSTIKALAIVGAACGICLVALAAPLLLRMAGTDYATAYAAYKPDDAGAGAFAQVVAQFGPAVLLFAGVGLTVLIRQPRTRQLAILLLVQACLSLALFGQVQGLLGVQHYYLLVPAVGIAIAALVIATWDWIANMAWRTFAIAALLGVLVASSVAVFSPSLGNSVPLLPRYQHPPLVRNDLAEIDRLMSRLRTLKPDSVYVVASSELLNWDTLKMACQAHHQELCPRLATSADIDARDGFPHPFLRADTVVLATPTQYHVRAEDQQVVGLLARDLRKGRGVGQAFQRLPDSFVLQGGIIVSLYRRVRPIRAEDAKALSDELLRAYPHLRGLFEV